MKTETKKLKTGTLEISISEDDDKIFDCHQFLKLQKFTFKDPHPNFVSATRIDGAHSGNLVITWYDKDHNYPTIIYWDFYDLYYMSSTLNFIVSTDTREFKNGRCVSGEHTDAVEIVDIFWKELIKEKSPNFFQICQKYENCKIKKVSNWKDFETIWNNRSK